MPEPPPKLTPPWKLDLRGITPARAVPDPAELAANEALGRILVQGGWIWLAMGGFGMLFLVVRGVSSPDTRFAGAVFWLVAYVVGSVACGVVGSLMVGYGRRLQVPPGEPLLMDPTRPLVLYLRSFGVDADLAPGTELETAFRDSAEQALARRLETAGQLVAIGRPGEPLPPLGAPRVYRADADWQATVVDLMRRSRLTVLAYGASPGLVWEIHTALEDVPAGRLLLWFPTRALWHAFRDFTRVDPRWTRGLPATSADVHLLAFHDDGAPRVLEVHATTITHDFSTELIPDPTAPGEVSPGGLAAYLEALPPAAEPRPKPRVG